MTEHRSAVSQATPLLAEVILSHFPCEWQLSVCISGHHFWGMLRLELLENNTKKCGRKRPVELSDKMEILRNT